MTAPLEMTETESAAAEDELRDRGTFTSLSDDIIAKIIAALRDEQHDIVKSYLENMGPKDTAELLSKISLNNRYALLEHHLDEIHPESFVEMDYDIRTVTLELLQDVQVAQLLSKLETDDAVDVMVELDPLFQKQILKRLSAKDRLALEEGLTYPRIARVV